jgi:hypothetical protein
LDGGGVRAVRAVHGVPVLPAGGGGGEQQLVVRGHELLLRHRLQHPRQALRDLRLHPAHLRLRRRRHRQKLLVGALPS